MNDAPNGNPLSADQLKEALEATTKRLQRLVRVLGQSDLDAETTKELQRVRRQLRDNRQLLGIAPRGGSGA